MKIFINKPNENWICDRLRDEFYKYNPEICTESPSDANIIWIMAPWIFSKEHLLRNKFVIKTIHHIVPNKFNKGKVFRFDEHVDLYHTPSLKSKGQIEKFTQKQIKAEPWWINQNIWIPLDKADCREELKIDKDCFLIGSFQRDTEGGDLKSPKLEKGPDQFCDIVEDMFKTNKKIHILLGGWRRQYIIARMKSAGIPYTYLEKPSFEILNKMYNSLDLYIVASRYEGGPQSIPECAATKTPVISTDVGCATFYLNKNSIYTYPDYKNAVPDCDFAYEKASEKFISKSFSSFINILPNISQK